MLVRALIYASRTTPLGRGDSRRLLYAIIKRLHPAQPFDVELFGAPVRLHPQFNITEEKALMQPSIWDRHERAAIRRAIRDQRSIFVDIGANAGLYSLDAAIHAGAGSTIIAIEPRRDLLARLAFNESAARRRGVIPEETRIVYCEAAADDHDGTGTLSEEDDEGTRHLVSSANGTPVTTRSLQSLVAELGIEKIDALKIDIEGTEDRAIIPFMTQAPSTLLPRVICIEHGQSAIWREDAIESIAARGYTVFAVTHSNTAARKVRLTRRPSQAPPAFMTRGAPIIGVEAPGYSP